MDQLRDAKDTIQKLEDAMKKTPDSKEVVALLDKFKAEKEKSEFDKK